MFLQTYACGANAPSDYDEAYADLAGNGIKQRVFGMTQHGRVRRLAQHRDRESVPIVATTRIIITSHFLALASSMGAPVNASSETPSAIVALRGQESAMALRQVLDLAKPGVGFVGQSQSRARDTQVEPMHR